MSCANPFLCQYSFSANHKKCRKISTLSFRRPVRIEQLWVAAGTDIRNRYMFFCNSRFFQNNLICLPQIQLIFSIFFLVEQFFPVFFVKAVLKLFYNITAHFITVLTDRRSHCCQNILRVTAIFFLHPRYRHLADFPYCSSPSGMTKSDGFLYRIRTGEIDLIARDGRYLVFAEVKYRKNLQMGDPLEAVDLRKQQQIYRTAIYYLHQKKWENVPCRFDVIGITGTQICHIRNAFGSI